MSTAGLTADLHRGLIATRAAPWFLSGYSASTPPIPPVEPELSVRSALCAMRTRTIISLPRPSAGPATQQIARCRSRESCVPRLGCAVVGSAIPRGRRPHPGAGVVRRFPPPILTTDLTPVGRPCLRFSPVAFTRSAANFSSVARGSAKRYGFLSWFDRPNRERRAPGSEREEPRLRWLATKRTMRSGLRTRRGRPCRCGCDDGIDCLRQRLVERQQEHMERVGHSRGFVGADVL